MTKIQMEDQKRFSGQEALEQRAANMCFSVAQRTEKELGFARGLF